MTDERTAATRDSWQTVDCNEPFVALPWHDSFSESQFDLIRRGAIPESMDDRWFAFYEEPMLFLYRSWSGHLIYRVTFARNGDVYVVQTAQIVDRGGYSIDVPAEVAFLDFLIHRLLLNESPPRPPLPRVSLLPRRERFHRWLRRWRLRIATGARG